MKFKSFLIFLVCLSTIIVVPITCRKICATEANLDACQQLARNLTYACNNYLHNVDCLLGIESNQSHVGRVTGEQAVLGANLLKDNVVVLGEIRDRYPLLQTVVIVRSNIANNFINLKDKKFCHPGFEHDQQISRLLLKEFENEIVKLNQSFCDKENVTLVEKHVRSLSSFFGDSCRPGFWSQNTEFDATLKTKYSSLCNLCEGHTCDALYASPFKDALNCLTKNNADVAVSTLQEARVFFSVPYNRDNFKYLCRDGSSSSYLQNCTCSSVLPDLIVAERGAADDVKSYLQDNLSSKIDNPIRTLSISNPTIVQALTNILKLDNNHEKITFLPESSYKSLKDYVRQRRDVPNFETSLQCDLSFKWCTYTDMEQEKCKWLSQAAMNWGIQPVVQCSRSQGDDELSCLDDIKKNVADIVVASSDSAYISLNKGLKTIAYPETDTRYLSTVLVVKKADDTTINNFANLKGKQACIPQFGGKEHLAFIDHLRANRIVDDTNCDYGNLLSDFVSTSCVPGVRSSLIKESTEYADKDKLCSLCRSVTMSSTATYCNANTQNKYYGSEGALKCLSDGVGDFAVVSKTDVENQDFYQVICKNDKLALQRGLQVDNDCALDVIATSEVISEAGNSKNQDIVLALYEYERWFGQNLYKPFHLFDRFNETLDLIFRDSTPGLSFSEKLDYMKNYKQLLDRAKDCKDSNDSVKMTYSIFITMISFVVLFIDL